MGFWDDLWTNIGNWQGIGGGAHNPKVQGSLPRSQQTDLYKQRADNERKTALKEATNSEVRSPMKDNWQLKSEIFGANNLSNTAPKDLPGSNNAGGGPGLSANAVTDSSITEGYLREIQDRLANSRAVAPTVNLNTRPVDEAKDASLKALQQALQSVIGNTERARTNTKQAYGEAQESTQGAYDHIVGNSRREGKKAAEDSGNYAQEAMSNAASVALAGTNQDMTNSDDLLAKAAANLGGNKAVVNAVDKKVDPNNSTESIRNNISQNYQDSANNAASQTARDITASGRMADTIASDGAGAISDLVAELANRNNQYDRDIVDAQNTNASNTANIQSSYADKLMQAQLAQQQEQNSLNNSAWQTNVANDSNALQGMIDLIGSENKGRMEQELMNAEALQKQSSTTDRSKNDQLEILLKGLVSNTDKNTLGQEDIMELLRQIQG